MRDDWWPTFQYLRVGFYYAQLRCYFDLFERGQIKIYLQEDLRCDTLGVVQDAFRFLEVADTYVPDVAKTHNGSGIPKNQALEALLGRPNPVKHFLRVCLLEGQRVRISNKMAGLRARNLTRPPRLLVDLRKRLIERYRNDILGLQGLIQRDFSGWFWSETAGCVLRLEADTLASGRNIYRAGGIHDAETNHNARSSNVTQR